MCAPEKLIDTALKVLKLSGSFTCHTMRKTQAVKGMSTKSKGVLVDQLYPRLSP